MPLTATCEVKIDNERLDDKAPAVVSIIAYRDLSAPGWFELRMNNRTTADPSIIYSDDPRFDLGNAVEIAMGYGKEPERVMTGEITGVELELDSGEEMLVVSGYDRGHRLLRGRKTRSFCKVKYSDIASRLARENGLSASVESTQVAPKDAIQPNQTDWGFLQQLAHNLGHEILVDDEALIIRSPKNDAPPVLTLAREAHETCGISRLIEFRSRLSASGEVGAVNVRGWSHKDKAVIIGKASAGSANSTMGGSKSGPAAADCAFGHAEDTFVEPLSGQEEADQIARGRFKAMALAHVAGEGLATGSARLKAGTVIRINGFGNRFSGLYYLDSVRHTYSPRHGYQTSFTLRRNAT